MLFIVEKRTYLPIVLSLLFGPDKVWPTTLESPKPQWTQPNVHHTPFPSYSLSSLLQSLFHFHIPIPWQNLSHNDNHSSENASDSH